MLFIFGLVLLLLEIVALCIKLKYRYLTKGSPTWRTVAICTWTIGLAIAFVSAYTTWSWSEAIRVHSFPFPAEVSVIQDGRWITYGGIITYPLLGLNLIICAYLPQIFVAMALPIVHRAQMRMEDEADEAELQ